MQDTVYLVVEPMAIIARDLALTVQDCDPSARVLVAETADSALQILAGVPDVQLAFVHVDPNRFAHTNLAQALHDLGAKIVFFGSAAEEGKGGNLVLQRPFTAQTVAAFLQTNPIAMRA